MRTLIPHNDIAYFIGGGIAGHVKGIKKGATLFLKAIESFHVEGKQGNAAFTKDEIEDMANSEWTPAEVTPLMRERAQVLRPLFS